MVKVIIPVADDKGEKLSAHFGRAPYFAWFEVSSDRITDKGMAINDDSHFGGRGQPPERIMALGADVIISTGMGMRAIKMFQDSSVAVLQAKNMSAEQSIKDFIEGNLEELTEGCLQVERHDH